jgi:type IV pilus assembly protein PilY1
MLHAVNGNQTGSQAGQELWSFVPPEFYGSIVTNHDNGALNFSVLTQPTAKPYGMDGPVNAYKKSSTEALVFATMRRGGRALYAFDYDFANNPTTPTLAWKVDNNSTGYSGLGQTWSTPKVMKTGWTTNPVMLIMGGGYDTCQDADPNTCTSSSAGNHIYVMDAATGDLLNVLDTDSGVVGDVTVVPDSSGNSTYAYAADMGGNIYRISASGGNVFGSTDPSKWVITKIASLGCDTVTTCSLQRKFMFAPDVVPYNGTNYILIGSGDREKPLYSYTDAYDTTNYFFMVKDQPTNGTWLSSENSTCGANVICLDSLSSIASNPSPSDLVASKGWYLSLSSHEQVVTSSITLYGVTTFSTHIAAPAPSPDECTNNLGSTYVYNISYLDASSANGTGTPYQLVSGGGLPPSPVAGLVQLSAEDSGTGNTTTVPFVIGASPTSPEQAGPGNGPPASTINQPKRRVYWYIQQ